MTGTASPVAQGRVSGVSNSSAVVDLSTLAADVLPHDLLLVTSHDGERGIVIEASSRDDWPAGTRFGERDSRLSVAGDIFAVVENRKGRSLPLLHAGGFIDRLRAHRFRSMLVVSVPETDGRVVLTFCARARFAFSVRDLRAAQRLARHFPPSYDP